MHARPSCCKTHCKGKSSAQARLFVSLSLGLSTCNPGIRLSLRAQACTASSCDMLRQAGTLYRRGSFQARTSVLQRCGTTTDRSYPSEPRVGVGVVILRPSQSSAEVLLIKRGKAPSKGQWSFPGGSQELGETLVECAMRESQEETGLILRNNAASAADVISKDDQQQIEYHYTIVEVAAVPEDPNAEACAASDVDDIQWVAVSALHQHEGLVVNAARIAEEAADRFEI